MTALGAVLALAFGCTRPLSDRTPDGRLIVDYWEKWTGFEGDAMQAVVDDFNASQTNIFVQKLTVSGIDRKMLLATAGGNPPDVAGLWSFCAHAYADKGALFPLDKMLAEKGMKREDYIPVMWDLCSHRGFVWALPSTPGVMGLHWNKKLFREAGLDPDKPPTSIAELDAMAERLTLVSVMRNGKRVKVRYPDLTPEEKESRKFEILQLGYSPSEPGWWNAMWCFWFGGQLWDGQRSMTVNSPENIETLRWFQSYPQKFGLENMLNLGSSFGNFSSPQNPFLAGTVAMVLQGVWMFNFIDKYAPSLEWGAAPFPSKDPVKYPMVTIAECDILCIPKGARHPKEAFEFMAYVNSQGPAEKLNLGQRKFSPLAITSADFIKNHPNPYIQVFIDMAKSPNANYAPKLPTWTELVSEMGVAYDQAFRLLKTPEEALGDVQTRLQWRLDRILRRWDMVEAERLKQWKKDVEGE
ncbi:MAG: ABC transporter substrate-binding protein [Verrucomicrobiota bacterium]